MLQSCSSIATVHITSVLLFSIVCIYTYIYIYLHICIYIDIYISG